MIGCQWLDNELAVTASWDRSVRRWDLENLGLSAEELLAQVTASWGLTLHDAQR